MPSCCSRNAPCVTSPMASATVETVNDRPKACTSSSLSSRRACKKGTAGMTKTPVAPVIAPVRNPMMGHNQRSRRGGTHSAGESNAYPAYTINALPSPSPDHNGLTRTSSAEPATVPTTIPTIIGHSRPSRRVVAGPASSCQTFVTKEVITSVAAASAGGITVPSNPMATVGRPMPVMPLTKPAPRKVKVSSQRRKISFITTLESNGSLGTMRLYGLSLRIFRRLK